MKNTHLRQLQFLPPKAFEGRTVHIIGCGGLGSPTALLLAKMGATKMNLYDLDIVEDVNINNQLFGLKDIGITKVEAVKENIEIMSSIDPSQIKTFHGDVLENPLILNNDDIVVLALDSNDTRRELYKRLISSAFTGLVVDPRMGGLVFSVYMSQGVDIIKYENFTPTDSKVPDDVCTAKAIAFNTFGCASVACGMIRSWLMNEIKMPNYIQMDMKNNIIVPITS